MLCHTSVNTPNIYILFLFSAQIIRQILATALGGDCVQVGLFLVAPVAVSPEAAESSVIEIPLDASEPADAISNPDPNLPLRCTFQIIHTFAHNTAKVSPIPPGTIAGSRKPALESLILRRLVHHISASLTCELTDMASTCKLSMTLERGSPAVVNPVIILSDNDPILQAYPDIKLSEEPTLEDLAQFVGSLKGKRVFLYADAAGIFAQHLTSYLTSWGLYVSHASSDSDTEGSDAVNIPSVEHPPVASEARGGASILQTLDEQDLDLPPSAPQTPKAPNHGPSFILIDDDISVLRERLQKLRVDVPHPFQFSRKRPNLAANHRPRSSPQVVRSIGHSSISSSPRNASVIVHFTSLANFKLVKGILQSVLGPNLGTTSRLPEVIIIPKPAGPRRVLTALHTAAVRPIVDPFFSPIATSPISPGLYPAASYFHQNLSPKSPMSRPSSSPRTYSNHSMRSPKAAVEPISDAFALPPSPLGLTEGIDYFAEAAEKLGSSPSSGLVIQSPSGQPAGIFFHPPRARGSRPSSNSVSAENTVYSRGSRRHSDSAERTRPAGGVTFLNLPTSMQQRCSSIAQAPGPTGSGTATHMTAIPGGEVPAAAGYTGTSPGTRQVGKRTGAIEVLRKTASPPSSPRTSPTGAKQTPARWGSGSRRSQAEKGTSPSPMRKSKPTEPSIVPPISVLIVEGVCISIEFQFLPRKTPQITPSIKHSFRHL
jgi:osomolarity two-component system response regulator SSK1